REGGGDGDDANNVAGAGCRKPCGIEPPRGCGNGIVAPGEDCDAGRAPPPVSCCDATCHIPAGCEIEPNDTPDQADGPIVVPGFIRGQVWPDPDFHRITIPAAADLSVTPKAAPGPGPGPGPPIGCSNYGMTLTLWSGATVVEQVTTDLMGCLALRATAPAGEYLLEVEALFPTVYNLRLGFDSLCGDGVVNGTETVDGPGGCSHQATCGDGILTPPE